MQAGLQSGAAQVFLCWGSLGTNWISSQVGVTEETRRPHTRWLEMPGLFLKPACSCSGCLQGGFDQGGGQAGLPVARLDEIGLEAVAEGHQFIDFGDDAVLFGEGGDGR